MEKITFTFTFLILATFSLFAQRGGNVYCHDTHQGNHVNQQHFSSMTSLNRGNSNGGLRPNTNVGANHHGHDDHDHGHDAHAGHGHGHGHANSTCSHGQSCTFGCANNHYIHVPVQVSAFDSWLYGLSHQSNSAVQMDMALDYVEHNWLTTHQIYDILNLFNNQSIMLRIAESAYPNTCDPQNYHQLYNCFSNSACVLHLQNFVVGR